MHFKENLWLNVIEASFLIVQFNKEKWLEDYNTSCLQKKVIRSYLKENSKLTSAKHRNKKSKAGRKSNWKENDIGYCVVTLWPTLLSLFIYLIIFSQGERALFLESHRNCFDWIDEWFGMTMQQIREIEQQSGSSLNEVSVFHNISPYESNFRSCVMCIWETFMLQKDFIACQILWVIASKLEQVTGPTSRNWSTSNE